MSRVWAVHILGVVLLAALCWTPFKMIGDPGLGWHLRSGEWMVANRELPLLDPFILAPIESERVALQATPQVSGASQVDGFVWIHDQWLADILLWRIYSVGGFGMLCLLMALVCVGASVWVMATALKPVTKSAAITLLTLFLCAMPCSIQWFVRPVVLSFLGFSYVNLCCQRWWSAGDTQLRRLWFLPALFLCWANLHPGFVLGLFTVGTYLFCGLLTRRTSLARATAFFSLATISTLVNPWGYKLHLSILKLASSPYFTRLNAEWLPPSLFEFTFAPFYLLAALLLIRARRTTLPLPEVLVMVTLFVGALMSRRYIPFFALAATVPIARILEVWFAPLLSGVTKYPVLTRLFRREEGGGLLLPVFGTTFILCWLALYGRLPGEQPGWLAKRYPLPVINWLALSGEPGPVFHTPDMGGIITFKLWPDWRPFIDDRNQLLGEARYRDYFKVVRAEPGWEEVIEKFGFKYLVLSDQDPLASLLATNTDWRQSFRDSDSKLLVFSRVS